MNLDKIKKIHFVGIGGIGISAIAKKFLLEKKDVTGSDQTNSFIIVDLMRLGAQIKIGHDSNNLPQETELLIYSASVPDKNPERTKASKFGVQQMSYPEILGELTRHKKNSITISGNKGKTTTTLLTGLILEKAGFDPEVVVGGYLKEWQGNYRPGSSDYLVAEACEWKAHMLNTQPKMIILTNIEADHLDYYKNLENIISAFQEYVNKLPSDGLLVINNDDLNSKKLNKPSCIVLTYGLKDGADLIAKNISIENGQQLFEMIYQGKSIGNFQMSVPGRYNIANALAASLLALSQGVKPQIINKVLSGFRGSWRRFEILGKYKGALVVSDYAHHPSAVSQALAAAKEFYPDKRLVLAFHPHHHHRTKSLFNDFVKSFDQADLLILNEIYRVTGRDEIGDEEVSSLDLVKAVEDRDQSAGRKRIVLFGKNLAETKELILENIKEGDLLIVMGAGDLYLVAEGLFK